uniref:BTB domain-containing protein n=1 Tax=Panagrolaimus sp. ES5 TaxID=591445 RepID=A0AC34FTK5_9BILA
MSENSENVVMESDVGDNHSSESSHDDEENESDITSDSDDENESENEPNVSKRELFEMLSNDRFADVILVISDTVEIKSHRCILGYSSKKFADIFENTKEIPVRISVESFEAETVEAALEFLYGKSNAIKGKEKDLFKFAKQFQIEDLEKACQSRISRSKIAVAAYFIWLNANRELIAKPGMSAFQVAKAAGEAWRDLPDKI